ncbi:hypothetical protein Tco_0859105 [Tanacetum coccineum]|uniref:Uncharacterized protein n=1 Tax=Tanacetum coccineum TaxID=301880 RepID=A0ABQ5BF06_9ASTR
MRADELHKLRDGTLNDVRAARHDIDLGIRMEYMPKRKWSRLDKRRARVMIQDIEKHHSLTVCDRTARRNELVLLAVGLYRWSNLRNRTAYTAYSDPQGVIYKDQNNKNRLMRTDELHKFNDGTLNDVRTALHDIASGIRMEYLPKRK